MKSEKSKKAIKFLTAGFIVLLICSGFGTCIGEETSIIKSPSEIVVGTGTYFEIVDSSYLNFTLESTETVHATVESEYGVVNIAIENVNGVIDTELTFGGLEANKQYYLYQDGNSVGSFVADEYGEYSYVQDITELHHLFIIEVEVTIYLRPGGVVIPSTAPITVNGNVYTLTDNIYESIYIQSSGIILDGNGYTLQGTGGYGVYLSGVSQVTVENCIIKGFPYGIWALRCSYGTFRNNVIEGSGSGVWFYSTSHMTVENCAIKYFGRGIGSIYGSTNTFVGNDVSSCSRGFDFREGGYCIFKENTISNNWMGISLFMSNNNLVYHNNFITNSIQVQDYNGVGNFWDNGYPIDFDIRYHGGNYWSDYTGVDLDGDLIGETPYSLGDVVDRYPFVVMDGWFPPEADAGTSYVSDEGTEIIFDASGSYDPKDRALQYRWDIDNDGVWDTVWSLNPTTPYIWYDDHLGMVKVEVSNGVLTDTDTATVTVNNVAPVAEVGLDKVVDVYDIVHFNGSFADPGLLDTHTILWEFGDGNIVEDTLTPTNVYDLAGNYTVTLTITDDDEGVGTDNLNVEAILSVVIVEIDIKPGSYPNMINLGSNGVIPVAILGTANLNVEDIDSSTVELAGAGVSVRGKNNKYLSHIDDINGDGFDDLVCQVETENLDPGIFQGGYAILTGTMYDGTEIEGRDVIYIVPE